MSTAAEPASPPLILERTLRAPVEKVWRLWTTKDGLARWWGPEGFTSVVNSIDVRVGGGFEIAMTAVLPQIVEMLTKSGVPVTSLDKGRYTAVEQHALLAWESTVDFVPDTAPYASQTRVELTRDAHGGTRVVVTLDRMHDAHWTRMKSLGWDQQLSKLEVELRT